MEVYTLKEVAEKLGVTVPYLRKEIKTGNLKVSLVGRRYIITDKNLEEFIKKLQVN